MSKKSRFQPKNTPKTHGNPPKTGGKRSDRGQEFAESPTSLSYMTSEFATRPMSEALAALMGLPNPDPILRAEGKSLEIYRSMTDGHLSSVRGKRFAAVTARPWMIERGKASKSDHAKVQEIFDSLDVRKMTKACLASRPMGYSVQEVMWGQQDGWYIPVKVVDRRQEWFRFGTQMETLFLPESGTPVVVPARKFLVSRNDDDSMNPYGRPIMSECFWPLAFKRGGLKFWMLFCEKFGLPKTVGKVPASMSDRDKLSLLIQLENMVRAAAAVIPIGSEIELLETKFAGQSPFKELVKWADSEMSKAWLGETLTTETQGNTGNRAMADVHNQVRADLALDDANMVEATMNQLITWIWEVNGLAGPMPWFAIQMPEDLQGGRLQRDQGLRRLGLRFTPAYFEDVYNMAPEHIAGVDKGASASDPAFAEPEATEESLREELLGNVAASLDDSILQDQAQDLVGPILELIQGASSFDDVASGLRDLVADQKLHTQVFEELLAKVGTICEGIGMMTDA